MSTAGVVPTSFPHGVPGDKQPSQWVDDRESRIDLADTFLVNYNDSFDDDYAEQSWLPLSQTALLWDDIVVPVNHASRDEPLLKSKPYGGTKEDRESIRDVRAQELIDSPQSSSIGRQTHFSDSHTDYANEYQRSAQEIHQVPHDYGNTHPSQTPESTHPDSTYTINGAIVPQLQSIGYNEPQNYVPEYFHEHAAQLWSPPPQEPAWQNSNIDSFSQYPHPSVHQPAGMLLDWSLCEQSSVSSSYGTGSPAAVTVPKRKIVSEAVVSKASVSNAPRLSECVDVFENSPGALASVKRRKKLDAPVRKAAKEVRRAGACHQCRFRKRTCSTGTPCASCLKHGNGLHEIRCQRESPFVRKSTHEYFKYSSNRRVLSFDLKSPLDSSAATAAELVTIDGIGRLSYTIQLPARREFLRNFDGDTQMIILQTEDSRVDISNQDDPSILILENDESLGTRVEQWAVEYTSKFVQAAGPKFYSTTIAQILGTAYVKKGLPESALVAAMLRVASLSFILRAGVKFTTSGPKPSTRFRTIQATIDTILYRRLQLAEKDLYQRLQRLIFRSAGCLTRAQVYPVALVLWQLLRFCCLAASHLSNIAHKYQPKALGNADYQYHGMKLVLSTHMALFRSSNPLLLNMSDKFNKDLVGGDKQLIQLAAEMRKVVMTFKEKGCPELKGSITYKKGYFDQWRKVYD